MNIMKSITIIIIIIVDYNDKIKKLNKLTLQNNINITYTINLKHPEGFSKNDMILFNTILNPLFLHIVYLVCIKIKINNK
jgi:hypothetical protein